jgi:transketolase
MMARIQKVTDIKQLKLLSNTIRQDLIRSLVSAGSGHSGGPLGMADVFTVLYFNLMNHDPANPDWDDRDRFVLSNGHICPVLYATMANAGYLPREELLTLRKLGTRLQGHPHRGALPGIETTSGPLGSGLSQSAGMALAAMMDKKKWRVYCMMSDGEQDAGNVWEAVLFAAKYKLRNLTAVIDRNNIQIDGHTEDIMPLESLRDKYEAFGWHVIEVDGHNHEHLIAAFNEAKAVYEKPTCIIAHVIPGKGVSYMENDHEWHGKPPTKEQGDVALAELQHWREQIEQGVDG